MEFGGHHTPLRSPEAGVSQFESVGQRLAAPGANGIGQGVAGIRL